MRVYAALFSVFLRDGIIKNKKNKKLLANTKKGVDFCGEKRRMLAHL